MALSSIGDLARGLTLQARSTQIRKDIERLSYELSSGQVRDVAKQLGGDYSQLAYIDNSLTRLEAFSVATSEAALFADAMQVSLTTFDSSVSDMSSALLAFGSTTQSVAHEQVGVQARETLDTMISALNTRAGGRALFSGTATGSTPLADRDTWLAELRTVLSGLTSADDVQQAAQTWFDNPAGFQAVLYQGSSQDLSPLRVSEDEEIGLSIRADDVRFRQALRSVTVAALATDPALSLPPEERTALFEDLGVDLANANDSVVSLRAQVGVAEAKLDAAATRNAASRTSLTYARAELIGADPYDTATRLETVQFQLESLYSVTVRNANLSLVNFLR